MIDMLKRHEIQVLRRAGHTLEEVAKLAGVAQSSVQRVEAETPRAQTIQHILRSEFEKVDRLWDDYASGRTPRHAIRDRTRFSKYIISIIRHLKVGD